MSPSWHVNIFNLIQKPSEYLDYKKLSEYFNCLKTVRILWFNFHVLLKYSAGPSNDSLCDIDLNPYILDFDYTDP